MNETKVDSRVEKLADHWKDPYCEARHFIREFERAGLVVLDPATAITTTTVEAAINASILNLLEYLNQTNDPEELTSISTAINALSALHKATLG